MLRTLLPALLSSILVVACSGKPENVPSGGSSAAAPAMPQGTPLPALNTWTPDPSGVTVTASGNGFVLQGNNTQFGYQLTSPAFPVPAGSNAVLRVNYKNDAGTVCPGVLTEDRKSWVLSPGVVAPELPFNTGKNSAVYVVLANCNPTAEGNPNSRAVFTSPVTIASK